MQEGMTIEKDYDEECYRFFKSHLLKVPILLLGKQ